MPFHFHPSVFLLHHSSSPVVAVTTSMAPHFKYTSPAWILSKFQTCRSSCLLGRSNSKLNLGCVLNISSAWGPYLSCSYRNSGNLSLYLPSLLNLESACFLILPPGSFSCLDSVLLPLSEVPSSLPDNEIQPLPMLSGPLQGMRPTTATRISKNFESDVSFPCLKSLTHPTVS